MPLTARNRTIAMKTEVTKGVAIDSGWTPADAPMVTFDADSSPAQEIQEQEPFSPSLGFDPDIVAVRSRSMRFETKLVGSGSIATPPPWAIAIKACGYSEQALDSVPIGSITGGPFLAGEGITSSGGATGTVAITTFSGTSVLYFVGLTGTVGDAETLTGTVSGATATTSAAESSAVGFRYRPISDDSSIDSLHIRDYNDGMMAESSGCRGNLTLRASTGQNPRLAFEFQGKDLGESDEALLANSAADRDGPRFANANFVSYLDGGTAFLPNADTMELSTGNEINLPKNFNEPSGSGYDFAFIGQRRGSGSIDAFAELVATHPFHELWANATTGPIEFRIGDTPGNSFIVQAPNAQYSEFNKGERDRRTNISLGLSLNKLNATGGNNELIILAV